jgi:two-component system OmpR family sensor kinase
LVSVTDRGPGLTAEERKRVFERFYRGASGKRTPGSGMGLFIVQEIIKVHDGTVAVENVPEGGARFSFRLPVAVLNHHE